MENLADRSTKLEDDLNSAVYLQDWFGAAATAAEIARTDDDWSRREAHIALAQTYATMAQAHETRVSNQIAVENAQCTASMQYKQDELNAAVAALATATREIASR